MGDFLAVALLIGALLFPFVAMPLMWRRMKRVREDAYRSRETSPGEQPWQEPIGAQDGLGLARTSDPNDELIGLGDKARHGRWPLDNQ